MIVHFIHWSQSIFFKASVLERQFPTACSDALQTEKKKNSLGLIYPLLSLSHTVISTAPSLPSSHVSFSTHLKYCGLLLGKYPTIPCVYKHTLTNLHGAGEPNSCFPIKSKQPLPVLLPCYLVPASNLSICVVLKKKKKLPCMIKTGLHSKYNSPTPPVHTGLFQWVNKNGGICFIYLLFLFALCLILKPKIGVLVSNFEGITCGMSMETHTE